MLVITAYIDPTLLYISGQEKSKEYQIRDVSQTDEREHTLPFLTFGSSQ